MPFVLDQATAFADFNLVAAALTTPLRPVIIGPQAKLVRFAQTAEKELGLLAPHYDPNSDHDYSYPNQPAGSKIDTAYSKLFIAGALLRYFQDLISVGSTIAPVSGFADRVRSDTVVFKTNAFADRDAALLRDVQPGDWALVSGSVGPNTYSVLTTVKGFVGEPVASTVGAASADAVNKSAEGASTTIVHLAGPLNCITPFADGTLYDGLAAGDIDETYTILVIQGSIGDDLTTARLRVTSLSGHDDQASVVPSALTLPTAIGTRGLTVTFELSGGTSCSSIAGVEDVSPDDLVVGQEWRVHVRQAFVVPAATSGGTYIGDTDDTYIITVTKGGIYANHPQITVSTASGTDASGPTSVTAANTAVACGSLGVTVAFNQTALCEGDRYYIAVTGVDDGALQTITLNDLLPTPLLTASDLNLTLYIKKDLPVPANRVGHAPAKNWTATAALVTVKAGILGFDAGWVDTNGHQVELPVDDGAVYVEYRCWLQTLVGRPGPYTLSKETDVAAALGTVTADNPLAYGVAKALHNSNGQPVRYTAVADPSLTSSWGAAIAILAGRDDLYRLVPLTTDPAVQALCQAQVDSESTAQAGRFRAAIFNRDTTTTRMAIGKGTSSDGLVVLATLADDPSTAGTQYTFLTVTSGNAQFITQGVVAGDTVRFQFTTDGFGSVSWTEYTVASVVNESALLLVAGSNSPVSTPQKLEIWHALTPDEIAADMVAQASSFNDVRVTVVAGQFKDGGVPVPGYFMAAAVAGLRGALAPHQGMRNLEVTGFDGISDSMLLLDGTQLDVMGAGGVWVVDQVTDGRLYTRSAVTSAQSADVNLHEEMVRNNVDAVGLYLLGAGLGPFLGTTNVTDKTLLTMDAKRKQIYEFIRSNSFTQRLGPMILAYALKPAAASVVFKDHVVVQDTLTVAYPDNTIELTLLL